MIAVQPYTSMVPLEVFASSTMVVWSWGPHFRTQRGIGIGQPDDGNWMGFQRSNGPYYEELRMEVTPGVRPSHWSRNCQLVERAFRTFLIKEARC